MFQRLEPSATRLRFSFEGQAIDAAQGDSIAAALLAAGIAHLRDTPVSAAPRGPWCLMGVCFDCLVEVDGMPNRQACLVPVAEGMQVRRMRGARAPKRDVP